MFTKPKPIRDIHVRGRQYKKVIDWEAVFGAIFLGVVGLFILGAIAG